MITRQSNIIESEEALGVTLAVTSSERLENYPNPRSESHRLLAIGSPFLGGYSGEHYFERVEETCGFLASIAEFKFGIEDLICWISESRGIKVEIARFNGRLMAPCVLRVFKDGIGASPHQDIAGWGRDKPDHWDEFDYQLAVNVYFQVPDEGGELLLWDLQFSGEEYQKRSQGGYGIPEDQLPPANQIVKPEVGDIIAFRSDRLHAVRPGKGVRCTCACFVGVNTASGRGWMWA